MGFAIFVLKTIFIFSIVAGVNCDRELYSPTITNWGTWGSWYECPPNYFATGFILKVHKPWKCDGSASSITDDMAVAGVRLICGYLWDSYNIVDTGDFGWLPIEYGYYTVHVLTTFCPSDSGRPFAKGFELRSEKSQGGGLNDDTAANNLRFRCANSYNPRNIMDVTGGGTTWGSWTGMKLCADNERICAIRMQIESDQGTGDDTAVNNLAFRCCNLPALKDVDKENLANVTTME